MAFQQTAHVPAFAGPDRAAISRLGSYAAATIFASAGLVLVALGAAFPLAVAVIEQQGLAVPAQDLLLAERLSALWPAFVAAGAANLAAALAVLDGGTLGKRIALVVAGVAVGLAAAAELAFALDGAVTGLTAGVTATFLVALVGTILVQRREV